MADMKQIDPELKLAAESEAKLMERVLNEVGKSGTVMEKVSALRKVLGSVIPSENKATIPSKGMFWKEIEFLNHDGVHNIRMRVYRPSTETDKLACVYHIHGGGMMFGGINEEDEIMQQLSNNLNAIVVNVEYRLAPENPYPAGLNDCYDGIRWVFRNADQLNIDRSRIGIMGESAGGGLAAAVTLLARDRGELEILFQSLIAPMIDDKSDTLSAREFSGIWPSWNLELAQLGWKAVLGEFSDSRSVPEYAAPFRAENLEGLPPTYVEVTELENFRDEDIEYGLRMMRSGVPVELHVYPGAFHCWYENLPNAELTIRAISNRMAWMRKQLTKTQG